MGCGFLGGQRPYMRRTLRRERERGGLPDVRGGEARGAGGDQGREGGGGASYGTPSPNKSPLGWAAGWLQCRGGAAGEGRGEIHKIRGGACCRVSGDRGGDPIRVDNALLGWQLPAGPCARGF